MAAETAAALASWDPGSLNQKLKTFSRILLLCNGSRTFHLLPFFLLRGLCLPPLKAFHRGSLKPVCQGLPQRGQEVGGSLREASVFHRCSQNPQDSCAGPLKCGLPPSFTEPLSSHENRPFPGVLATSGTSQDPCRDTCSSTPGKPCPQTWESPQRTTPPHGAGIGHEEACSDATLTASQRTGGRGREWTGWAARWILPTPSLTEARCQAHGELSRKIHACGAGFKSQVQPFVAT